MVEGIQNKNISSEFQLQVWSSLLSVGYEFKTKEKNDKGLGLQTFSVGYEFKTKENNDKGLQTQIYV